MIHARNHNIASFSFMLSALCFMLLSAKPTTTNDAVPGATNIIYQSKDGGQTWQDISEGLPDTEEEPIEFFAGESDVYLRINNAMYRSNSNLKTPVWKKENVDPQNGSIAFNRSAVMAYNYEGQINQRISEETWLPRFTNFKKHAMRTIYETSDGTIFLCFDHGLYRSVDNGKNWKQIQNQGWVMNMVEADGVLIATGRHGIMRSTDQGENWQWVINEGGVGIAVERIEGGFAAIAFNTKTQSRRIHVSLDNGKTWKAISDELRPSMFMTSIKQVGKYLLCGHPDGIFRSSDMGKTWSSVHASVDKKELNHGITLSGASSREQPARVFKIYVSGNVVYAVAGSAGC